jgi:hypothetical protein
MAGVIRALYISRARPDLGEAEIRAILEVSRARNAALGITGVLCGGKNDFIQVLEGPEQAIIKLYGTILDDPRHSVCALLSIAPIETRMFESWSMGYVSNETDLATSCRLLLSQRLTYDCREQIVELMQQFLKLVGS